MTETVLVLGAGPAGGAVALGLRRLGYAVTVIAQPRPFAAVEGISERVVAGLQAAGFSAALRAIAEPSARNAHWNGASNSANTEQLVDRQQLDAGIWQDLQQAGVRCISARVTGIKHSADQVSVQFAPTSLSTPPGELSGCFLVEARGRQAPSAGLSRLRGPQTVSLLQYWQGPAAAPQSAAVSFNDGWAWLAMTAQGRRYLQLTLDVASADLPQKAELAAFCRQRFAALPQAAPFMAGAQPVGEVQARTSTAVLCEAVVGERWIRVGDAAMAVDPLSGNGIFQALSSALQAPAVINTLLQHPERAALARQFHQSRVEALFLRFARMGRDFYQLEQQWPAEPFWQQRRQWPDQQPMHQACSFAEFEVQTLPVVQDAQIIARPVVVTPDQPLGVWHLAGVELAPLVEAVRERGAGVSLKRCLADQGLNGEALVQLWQWFRQQGVAELSQ